MDYLSELTTIKILLSLHFIFDVRRPISARVHESHCITTKSIVKKIFILFLSIMTWISLRHTLFFTHEARRGGKKIWHGWLQEFHMCISFTNPIIWFIQNFKQILNWLVSFIFYQCWEKKWRINLEFLYAYTVSLSLHTVWIHTYIYDAFRLFCL